MPRGQPRPFTNLGDGANGDVHAEILGAIAATVHKPTPRPWQAVTSRTASLETMLRPGRVFVTRRSVVNSDLHPHRSHFGWARTCGHAFTMEGETVIRATTRRC